MVLASRAAGRQAGAMVVAALVGPRHLSATTLVENVSTCRSDVAIIVCGDCGEERKHQAHGLCNRCWMRRYRAENPDSNRLTLQRWYAKNRQQAQHVARQRYHADPIRRFVQATNNSANRTGKVGRLTRDDVTPLFSDQLADLPSGRCVYCASVVAPGCNATLDHVDPTGLHALTNVVLSCISCNSSRQATPVEEFRQRLESDVELLDHILTRNKAKIAGFLVARYDLEIEDILLAVHAKRSQLS
jgi:hypothetical protein